MGGGAREEGRCEEVQHGQQGSRGSGSRERGGAAGAAGQEGQATGRRCQVSARSLACCSKGPARQRSKEPSVSGTPWTPFPHAARSRPARPARRPALLNFSTFDRGQNREFIQTCYVTIQLHTWASVSAALSPSEEQSEMGQPWSRVEKGQAPLLMWR